MGYYHYLTQKRDFTEKEWDLLKKIFKIALTIFPKRKKFFYSDYTKKEYVDIIIAGPDGKGTPIITDTLILFNGTGDLGFETAGYAKHKEDNFSQYVKTDLLPYDELFSAMNALVSSLFDNIYIVNSDGDMKSNVPTSRWYKAYVFATKVLLATFGETHPLCIKVKELERSSVPYYDIFISNLHFLYKFI